MYVCARRYAHTHQPQEFARRFKAEVASSNWIKTWFKVQSKPSHSTLKADPQSESRPALGGGWLLCAGSGPHGMSGTDSSGACQRAMTGTCARDGKA